jgi:hypothetical protein
MTTPQRRTRIDVFFIAYPSASLFYTLAHGFGHAPVPSSIRRGSIA